MQPQKLTPTALHTLITTPQPPLTHPHHLLLLDTSPPLTYHHTHIRSAINLTFPAIILRRIAAGKIDIWGKLPGEVKSKLEENEGDLLIVVYGESEESGGEELIARKLLEEMRGRSGSKKLSVKVLEGGLPPFQESYPEWVESAPKPTTTTPTKETQILTTLLGSSLGRLSLKSCNSADSCLEEDCVDEDDLEEDEEDEEDPEDFHENNTNKNGTNPTPQFPVQILPNLYLGNAAVAADLPTLRKHGIKRILNVTRDLPNLFEDEFVYLKIPISDHWTECLGAWWGVAIEFIDSSLYPPPSSDSSPSPPTTTTPPLPILIHCLAGISRSVTITMAYLMYKHELTLNEAYDVVRAKKRNISPNFHFMGQLLEFERGLRGGGVKGELKGEEFLIKKELFLKENIDKKGKRRVNKKKKNSPDSGIEFDHGGGSGLGGGLGGGSGGGPGPGGGAK